MKLKARIFGESCEPAELRKRRYSKPFEGDPRRFPSALRLRPGTQHVAEQRLAQGEFAWVTPEVKSHPIHHVGEADAGVRIGEPQRSACSRRPEGPVRRAEEGVRDRLGTAQREDR